MSRLSPFLPVFLITGQRDAASRIKRLSRLNSVYNPSAASIDLCIALIVTIITEGVSDGVIKMISQKLMVEIDGTLEGGELMRRGDLWLAYYIEMVRDVKIRA